MQFCEKLYALRQERGLTQKQVGEALSMAARQYQRFEKGEQKPGFDNLRNRPVPRYHGVGATLVGAPRAAIKAAPTWLGESLPETRCL